MSLLFLIENYSYFSSDLPNDNLLYYYIKWGFESRLKRYYISSNGISNYIKWGFESRLKPVGYADVALGDYRQIR